MPSDKGAERALLGMVLMAGERELLERLEPQDFHHPAHRYLFEEMRLLIEGGYPLEPAAFSRWFTSKPCKARAKALDFSAPPSALVAEVMLDYIGTAHREFYLKKVRAERVLRGVLWVSAMLADGVSERPDEVGELLTRAFDALGQLEALVHAATPQKVGA
jgi:replicative DNA helicase